MSRYRFELATPADDLDLRNILAATPMRKDFYTVAKALSNFAVLACMVLILMLAAVVMQFMLGEAHSFSLWKLWSPFIFLALPSMLLTSSLAVLFETIPGLRGGIGNVVYFFLWSASLGLLGANGLDDPTGLQLLYRSSRNALRAVDPGASQEFHFSLTIGGDHAVRTFPWNGIDWSIQVLTVRLLWIAVAVALALVASVFFHRFDPARSVGKRSKSVAGPSPLPTDEGQTFPSTGISTNVVHLTPLNRTRTHSRFVQLVVSELRLMLKGQRWWWYTAAGGMLIGQIVSPDAQIRSGFLVAAWIWPVLLWSQMGCREARNGTGSLLFSSEKSLSRQFPALWVAGLLVALLTGAGFGFRLLLSADWRSMAAWLVGAIFIPSLALALGAWSGGPRAFEAIYTIWWYIGPAHQILGLDFMGTTPASSSAGFYAGAAGVLLVAAWFRRRQSLGYA